jgi:DNA-binding transcriptional LysR family regulator
MIDYRYLKAFFYTAKFLSFSKAAVELHIAQSAVSRQIKLLEESIKDQLFIRSSKKIILSEKGKELYKSLLIFEKDLEALSQDNKTLNLRIGILHGLLEVWFVKVLTLLPKEIQGMITITVNSPENLKEGIENNRYDMIFSNNNIQSEILSSLKFEKEEFQLISKKEIDIKNLSDYTWIVYDQHDKLFNLSKKQPNKIINVNSITAIKTLVEMGNGIAIIPEHMLTSSDKLKTYSIKKFQRAELYLTTLNYQKMPAQIELIKKLIFKSLEQ